MDVAAANRLAPKCIVVRLVNESIMKLSISYTLGVISLIVEPRLGGAYCFRRVRSQRKSVDCGTMGPALGGAYECYAHISSCICFQGNE